MAGKLRLASAGDGSRLAAIYAPYVLETTITFETAVPTAEEFSGRICQTLESFPYLVWEEDETVTAYAYAHRFAERAAYDWTCECSIYADPSAQGTGAAQRLYGALMELLSKMGYLRLYSIITDPNPRSCAFHEAMGFVHMGTLPAVGYKHGRWIGTSYYCRTMAVPDGAPPPVLPFPQLDRSCAEEILRRWSTCPLKKKS